MNINYDTAHKTEVIIKHLLPALGCLTDINGKKITELMNRCRLHRVRKYDILESPGPRSDGYLWFPIHAMSHYFFFNELTGRKSGTRIWNKREFIFDDGSLLESSLRRNFLEILEDDEVLSISYTDLDYLMDNYEDINASIKKLSIKHCTYFEHKNFLMNLPTLERVKRFTEENSCFIFSTTQETQAIHVNLSRRTYIDHLIKIKEIGSKETVKA